MADELVSAAVRRARPRREKAPTTPDPVEIAMEALAGNEEPGGVSRKLLERNVELTDTQIALARHDLRHRSLQLLGERLSVLIRGLAVVAGLVVAVVLGVMVWQAAHTRSVIVEPFSVPPELAQQGLTGQVVASRLIDTLTRMRDETLAPSVPLSYGGEQREEVRLEIPQTGVSLGELQAFLRDWLGKETRITGEVTRQGEAYVLSVRAAAQPGDVLTGPAADLDGLMGRGAEQVYRLMEPERYGAWLGEKGRQAEATALYERLSIAGTRQARARATAYLALRADTPQEAIDLVERALQLDPQLPLAVEGRVYIEMARGDHGGLVDATEQAIRAWSGGRAREYAPWYAALSRHELAAALAETKGDFLAAARAYEQAGDPAPDQPVVACRRCAGGAISSAGYDYAMLGDGYNAGRQLERGLGIAQPKPERAAFRRQTVRLALWAGTSDWSRMADFMTSPDWVALGKAAGMSPQQVTVLQAQALARAGRGAAAWTLAKTLPQDCYDCLVTRGMAAAAIGNLPAAEATFAAAAQISPKVPGGRIEHARALLAAGRTDEAIGELKIAKRIAPGNPEADLLWGQALIAKGEPKAAAVRIALASKNAPRLGRLEILWGEALARAGDAQAARAHWRRAGQLTLSPADQARLARLARL